MKKSILDLILEKFSKKELIELKETVNKKKSTKKYYVYPSGYPTRKKLENMGVDLSNTRKNSSKTYNKVKGGNNVLWGG